jgi:hypothetical protein
MRRAIVPVATALLLLLSGCSGEDQVNVAVESATPPSNAVTASEEPLTAETPAEAPSAATPEAAFLVKVRDILPDNTSIPNATDAQLLAAGQEACEQMAGGADSTMVSVIDGEQKDGAGYYQDSARIGAVAKQTICP